MRNVLVRYQVKPENAEENEKDIRKLIKSIKKYSLDGFKYVTFKGNENFEFIHIVLINDLENWNKCLNSIEFLEFKKRASSRYIKPYTIELLSAIETSQYTTNQVMNITTIDSYRFFDN